MSEPLQIDVAAALSALETSDPEGTQMGTAPPESGLARNADGTFAPRTSETPAQVAEPVTATPDGTTPTEETPAAPDFTSIPDDALSPELLQMKRSLQADYTRKTQEIAPWRTLGTELGIENPEEFKTAGEVYKRISDPRNWPTIHGELTEYMQQYGMSPAAASAQASDQLAELALAAQGPDDSFQYEDDGTSGAVPPELVQFLQKQAAEINELKALVTGDQEERKQQAEWNRIAQALTEQETALRAANPHYSDDDITAIYHLMGQNGDMTQAAAQFESLIGARVAQYIQSKGTAMETTPSTLSGGGSITTPGEPERLTPEEGHRRAMALAAQLDAQG